MLTAESGVDQFIAELEQFTTELESVTVLTLEELAAQLPGQIISGLQAAGKNLSRPNSKGLRGSITASVQGTQLSLGMNYYGYYQIFGVQPGSALGLPPSVLATFENSLQGAPQGGDKFKFTKIKHPGIAPAPAAANPIINLADLIAETIAEQI